MPVSMPREKNEPILVSQPARQQVKDFEPRAINTEDIDLPTFLRNRNR